MYSAPVSERMAAWRERVERELDRVLPPISAVPGPLHEAMRSSVFAGGKRLRPFLCACACEAVCGRPEDTLTAGAALELFHTYTLIHDDLPAFDDDELRRGQPTCHVAFGEATAILAGDALQALAFEVLVQTPVPAPRSATTLVAELARAAGSRGVCGGQFADIDAEGQPADPERVAYIHAHKTAALIKASARIGAICGGASHADLEALSAYGDAIGVAFQITDDILDVTSSAEAMGKTVGSDAARGKMSWVSVHGLEGARERARELLHEAQHALAAIDGPSDTLTELAELIVERTN